MNLAKVERMFDICSRGDASRLRHCLDAPEAAPCWVQRESDGASALMVAAAHGSLACVDTLLLEGAPWNAHDNAGLTAGDHALRAQHGDVVDRLVSAGVQAQALFGLIGQDAKKAKTEFVSRELTYVDGELIDDINRGVMMKWELPVMEKSAALLCNSREKPIHVLNVGFGLGLIDSAIQKHEPTSHTIIEAHPQVYAHMIEQGWDQKATILFGRWQDVLASGQIAQTFDAIYFDTFDDVEDMKEFHEVVPQLLSTGGVYSFFCGLAGTPFETMVSRETIRLDLEELGLTGRYELMHVECLKEPNWERTCFRYYDSDEYYLPLFTQ